MRLFPAAFARPEDREGGPMAQRIKPELSPRLSLLADWVEQDARIADVGTDHGLLPVRLILDGRVASAIASDLRKGPLDRARETARSFGVSDRIDFRLCNGLSGITPEEADTVLIAGLGGENIADILAAAPWTRDGKHRLLLQPMSRAEMLRAFLAESGYRITEEALVRDRGILYPVLKVSAGEMTLTPGRRYGGALLEHDPLEGEYLTEKIIRLQNAVGGLNRSVDPEDREKADRLREVLTELLTMKEEWSRAGNRPGN